MNDTRVQYWGQLEKATQTFRAALARRHRKTAADARRMAREALEAWDPLERGNVLQGVPSSTELVGDVMREAASLARWHECRDGGQLFRFKRLDQCGSRVMIASCGVCRHERKPVLEGCGIARLCARCSLINAKKRRARFGRARSRAVTLLSRVGYTKRRGKIGPKWSDKMLTLTVPHFLRSHLAEGAPLLELGKMQARDVDTTIARIFAIRAAWPRFMRKYGRHLKQAAKAGAQVMMPLEDGTLAPPPMHRAFEWTPGGDGLGHPHFHVWMLCPWTSSALLQRWWTEALREVGVPLEAGAEAIVTFQRFRDFNPNATNEIIKGATKKAVDVEGRISVVGTKKALEWSRLYKHGPKNAFEYADGWTIAAALEHARPEVVASLYMALEGARLTQGSSGFFTDDEPPHCEHCKTQMCWHIRFEPAPPPSSATAHTTTTTRGPPS